MEDSNQSIKTMDEPGSAQSPVASLLGANTIAPDQHKGTIEKIIAEQQDALDCLEGNIAAARTFLSNLLEKREQAIWIRDAHAALISPIQRLSPEILAEIFHHCLPYDRHAKISPREAPLLLAAVCGRWRAIALSLSRLWTTVSVVLHSASFTPKKELLEVWLLRSKSLPYTLSLNQNDLRNSCKFEEAVAPVLTIVGPHISRLQHFHLRFFQNDLRAYIDSSAKAFDETKFALGSMLESAYISAPSLPERETNWLCSFILPAPKLRNVYWRSHRNILCLPLRQLTNLDFDPGGLAAWINFRDVLNCATNIISLRLRSIVFRTTPPGPAIHLPKLHSLTLPCDGDLLATFSLLTLPALKDLRIHPERGRYDPFSIWPHTQFLDFLARSSCSLSVLSLHNTTVNGTGLVEYLKRMPDLVKLDIYNQSTTTFHPIIEDPILQLLTPEVTPPPGQPICLVPKLEDIRFWKCIAATDGLFADMVEARWRIQPEAAVSRLQHVFATVKKSAHTEDIKRMKLFKNEGLHVFLQRMKGRND